MTLYAEDLEQVTAGDWLHVAYRRGSAASGDVAFDGDRMVLAESGALIMDEAGIVHIDRIITHRKATSGAVAIARLMDAEHTLRDAQRALGGTDKPSVLAIENAAAALGGVRWRLEADQELNDDPQSRRVGE